MAGTYVVTAIYRDRVFGFPTEPQRIAFTVVIYLLAGFPIYLTVPAGGIVYLVAIYLLRAVEPEEWALARRGVLARVKRN